MLAAPLVLAQGAHLSADKTADKAHGKDAKGLFARQSNQYNTNQYNTNQYNITQPSADQGKVDDLVRLGKTTSDTDSDARSDNRFDGSQFDAPSFQDSDFGKHSFIDLLLKSAPKLRDKPLSPPDQDSDAGKDQAKDQLKSDSDDRLSMHDDLSKKKEKHFDEYKQLLKAPVAPGPNDWVPDKLDPLDNGGFTSSPDNGSPVPYRLNGHVDLERALPWLKDN